MNRLLQLLRRLFGRRPFPRPQTISSHYLQRPVKVDLYLPTGGMAKPADWPCFIFNDGQDLPRMNFAHIMQHMLNTANVPPFAVVGLYAADRMREYGTADQADYAKRGDLAGAYEKFVTLELIPWLRSRYQLAKTPQRTIVAGFSLGGLSAFDLLWRHPDHFRTVGVFSGALWWRSKAFRPQAPDADRIAHQRVAQGSYQPGYKFWFQTGTEDEANDRNHNGIIDSIDDTRDLIQALESLGYQEGKDIKYVEVVGGKHEPATWGQAMPDFLSWVLAAASD